MILCQQLTKQQKEQLAIGAYCKKFGLTKADIEEVLHQKRVKEFEADSRKGENGGKYRNIPTGIYEKEFQLSVRDDNDSIVAYIYEDKGKMHAYVKNGYDVIFEKVDDNLVKR